MLLGSKVARLPILIVLTAPLARTGVARAQQQSRHRTGALRSCRVAERRGQAPGEIAARPERPLPRPPRPAEPPPRAPPRARRPSAECKHDVSLQGNQRPPGDADGEFAAQPSDVYSEDWWGHTRPILELHGYFRMRGELFHNFSLGRHDVPSDPTNPQYLWPQPLDNSYTSYNGTTGQTWPSAAT